MIKQIKFLKVENDDMSLSAQEKEVFTQLLSIYGRVTKCVAANSACIH